MDSLTQAQQITHNQLRFDFPFYSRNVLKIRDKKGALVSFIFNQAQNYLHQKLQYQILTRGFVRALILKGRKQGCSTYVGGRFYHKATTQEGRQVFILSHDSKTTGILFSMVDRYYQNTPNPLKPPTETKNKNQMVFTGLDSSYTVGTAGNENIGRGGTPLLFHGSEAAFWKNTEEIRSGIINSVPREVGTEIILESTAYGQQGMFYEMSMEALNGEGDYELIFIPWTWQPEYSASIPPDYDFLLSEEEMEIKYKHAVTNEQLYWRRLKIVELGSKKLFKQEYPFTIMEAFQSSGEALMELADIEICRKNNFSTDPNYEPLILGLDVAGPGEKANRTVLAYRRGRHIQKYKVYQGIDPVEQLPGIVAREIELSGADACFVDMGYGFGTVSRLKSLGYQDIVTGVNFGGSAIEKDIFANKRAEMLCTLASHIESKNLDIPDDDEFQMDLRMIPQFTFTSARKRIFPSKEEIKKLNGGKSCDIVDAVALTYAFPVRGRTQRLMDSGFTTGRKIQPESGMSVMNRYRNANKHSGGNVITISSSIIGGP